MRRIWVCALVVVVVLAGCTSPSGSSSLGVSGAPAGSAQGSTVLPAATAGTVGSAAVPTVQVPAPRGAGGAYLPVRAVTPGATNPVVTQASIGTTICRSGFTASIRPPVSYTDALKVTQLADGYAVNGNRNTAAYEEDHLIPLELGGSASSVRNLWPEPWERSSAHPAGFAAAGTGAQTKDRIEDSLRSRVCDGQLTLVAAQRMIAANWRAAFDTYLGAPPVTAVTGARPTPAATPASTSVALPVVHPGAFCSPPGARSVTTLGTAMVCKLDSKGLRYRWGRA